MTQVDDDELRVLQARAYGPQADIHLDARAMIRLRELEAKHAAARGGDDDLTRDAWSAPAASGPRPAPTVTEEVEPEAAAEEPPDASEEPTGAPGRRRPPRPVSRTGILIAVAVLVAAAIVVVSLVFIRRVQTAPLEPDAVQIARLARDPYYKVPSEITGEDVSSVTKVHAYAALGGLRAITMAGEDFSGQSSDDPCLVVFPPAQFTKAGNDGYFAWSGCQSGAFPAIAQLRITPDLPQAVRDAFQGGEVLQFVYDQADDEVVVFTTK
ncbi:hypothetical protein GCM10022286_15690 [Gryllotalpicola daejeonensis]|uniref:Uncharacterized protein n=1 Tax=Gryllotalpicola daejeonensis TaxID=993087 RepID=A0ABP7ZJF7_9MICO